MEVAVSAYLVSLWSARKGMIVKVWAVQDAKARFSEFLDASLKDGPQVVSRRGVETAVLVPIEEWKRMGANQRPTLKELLLADEPRYDLEIPDRKNWRWREPPTFDD